MRKLTETYEQDFASKRILLVDDHTHVLSILTIIINGIGMFRLSTADRSDRALLTLQAEPIDLVITDFNMSGHWLGTAHLSRNPVKKSALQSCPTYYHDHQFWYQKMLDRGA